MKAHLQTYPCGQGDCIALTLSEGEETFNILIDCGKITKEIETLVCEQWEKHINLLIVTHIDSDHITGVKNLLKEHGDLKIDKIWFNCYQRVPQGPIEQLTERQKKTISALSSRLFVRDVIGDISAQQALTLSEIILDNPDWKRAWKREYITTGFEQELCDGKFGKISFLSPSNESLQTLDGQYVRLFNDVFFKKKDHPYDEDASIYELLIQLSDEVDKTSLTLLDIACEDITTDTLMSHMDDRILDVSPANKASLSFIWEKDEKRFLFLGDAEPSQVESALKNKYGEGTQIFDAIKVSHHGSDHSTSRELMRLIDSADYFFTGGCDDDRPGLASIARIVCRDLPYSTDKRKLHFNTVTNVVTALDNVQKVKDAFKFEVITKDNTYDA